jgi:hypothetical protein
MNNGSANSCAELLSFLSDEIVCEQMADGTNRVSCVTPLEYPDGDAVVVWVHQRADSGLEVSDYGEGLVWQGFRPDREQKAMSELACGVAHQFGLNLFDGRLVTECNRGNLGESIWRVASAAAEIAGAMKYSKPQRRKETEENEFVRLVSQTLQERHVPVERGHKLQGSSGHPHAATIWVPSTHAIIEPVGGHWNQVASVFTKFSDLAGVNGFQRYSLLDDRSESPGEDVRSLLVGVSDVIAWSAHDVWLPQVTGGRWGTA